MTDIIRARSVNSHAEQVDEQDEFNRAFRARVIAEIDRLRLTSSWLPFAWDHATVHAECTEDDAIIWIFTVPGRSPEVVTP